MTLFNFRHCTLEHHEGLGYKFVVRLGKAVPRPFSWKGPTYPHSFVFWCGSYGVKVGHVGLDSDYVNRYYGWRSEVP